MRTRISNWLLPLFTLVLIAAGAAMPIGVSMVQDAFRDRAGGVWDLDTVSLTLRQDSRVKPVLKLLSNSYSGYFWESKTNMTGEEATAAAYQFLQELTGAGLVHPEVTARTVPEDFKSPEAAMLVSDTDPGLSAIVWNCYGPGVSITIDDATGMAVSAEVPISVPDYESKEGIYITLDQWTTFFQDYYSIELISIENTAEIVVDKNMSAAGKWDYSIPFAHFLVTFELGEDLGFCERNIWFQDGNISIF